ncbi:MAG: threonine synthase [Candidatus Hodarchaeales archaeon]
MVSLNEDRKLLSLMNDMKCTACNKSVDIAQVNTVCPSCGKVLFAKYDLEAAKESLTKTEMSQRTDNIWRFPEIMPVFQDRYRYTLGEGGTPLLKLCRAGKLSELDNLFLKDEGQNPTGTFKSRGLCSAVSKAMELGVREFVIPTAGNAGAALSAYAARAGARAYIYMPEDTPLLIQKEVIAFGGDLRLIPGIISDAAEQANIDGRKNGWFNISTLKEPYRVEGKKTMGFELAEQFNWELPEVIIYPTGGGTGIVGMWKAFNELETLGLIDETRPRMISVQSSGCAPIVRAYREGMNTADEWKDAQTVAAGLKVPSAIGDYLILRTIRESGGTAIAVDDEVIIAAMKDLARKEGIFLSPEAAATYAAVIELSKSGDLDKTERIVLFGTGSGLLYSNTWSLI